jgi:predicted aminopeptidase
MTNRRALLLTATFGLFLLLSAGCAGPSYYTQAVSGHLQLMGKRENIQAILDQGAADPELRRELELALEIRAFATAELGLPDNDSYTEFVRTGRQAVSWNVVAAPEFSLDARQWCFLVSGCVPYRGYFEQDKAARFAIRMEEKSWDVTISPAIAYSTLGWFDDPLLDTMLQYSDEQLAAFIFHELAHQQLYVKGATGFNEAYAGFIEEAGVRQWLQATEHDELMQRWKSMEKASARFNSLLLTTRGRLAEVYDSGRSDTAMRAHKKAIFSEMESEYMALVDQQWGGENYFKSWFSRELNNARLALINSYHGGVCAFRNLYESVGRDIRQFQQKAVEKAALGKQQRSAWLRQPCATIASGRDL